MRGIVRQGDADPLIRDAQHPAFEVVPTATIIRRRPDDRLLMRSVLDSSIVMGLPNLHFC
jgi:hypothetical protein